MRQGQSGTFNRTHAAYLGFALLMHRVRRGEFPLSVENIRCSAAYLKAGGYRRASRYMQAAVNHQLRFLKELVHPVLRVTIKEVVRSIKRGLGPSRLKEGFDVFALYTDPCRPALYTDPCRPSHCPMFASLAAGLCSVKYN